MGNERATMGQQEQRIRQMAWQTLENEMTHPSDTQQIEHPAAEFQGADDLACSSCGLTMKESMLLATNPSATIEQQAKRIEEQACSIALAREALEYYANHKSPNACCPYKHVARDALSTLTTGNAVQQIEALAYQRVIEEWEKPYGIAPEPFIDRLRKLAEQKEREA